MALRRGADPYQPFLHHGGAYDFQPLYNYPALAAWLLEPLAGLGEENAALVTLVVLQGFVALFAWSALRALRPSSRQETVLAVLLTIGFGPLFANLWNDQSNLVVLGLSGVALLGYVAGDAWWAGAAFGAEVAVKPLQPLSGLLLAWGRRGRMLAAAIVAGLGLLLVPGAGLAWEFLTRVLPAVAGGTGFRENAAPVGFLERLLDPNSFLTGAAPPGLVGRLAWIATAVAVLAATWWALGRRPRTDREGRALEFGLAVAGSPLLLTVATSFHLVLLLLPILVLLRQGIASGDRRSLVAAGAGWLLLGPVHSGLLAAIGSGFSYLPLLRVWNECQLLGILVLWLGCQLALRARPSSRPAQPSPPPPSIR